MGYMRKSTLLLRCLKSVTSDDYACSLRLYSQIFHFADACVSLL